MECDFKARAPTPEAGCNVPSNLPKAPADNDFRPDPPSLPAS